MLKISAFVSFFLVNSNSLELIDEFAEFADMKKRFDGTTSFLPVFTRNYFKRREEKHRLLIIFFLIFFFKRTLFESRNRFLIS